VESAIGDLKKALEGTDTAAIREASEKAAQASQKMGTAIYAQAQAQQAGAQDGAAGGEETAGSPQGDDVVDAEIVDEGPSGTNEGGAAR
jgi:molecular chaperone DnaK